MPARVDMQLAGSVCKSYFLVLDTPLWFAVHCVSLGKRWRKLDRLEKIHAALGDATPLVLHGTHPLSDKMVQVGMARGMVKVNQNRNIRNGYQKYITENCNKVELTTLQVEAVEEYAKGVERLMVEVFDSAGKA
jgi:fructose-bisphosphate aldolase class II